MPQSFASIHLHVVFSTKHRDPHITPDLAPRLYEYLGGTVRGTGSVLLTVGGIEDHVHLLVGLGREVSVAEFVKVVKAASSRWVHDAFADRSAFVWQAGYGAFAVSHDRLERVRRYIENQKEHHRELTFQDEYREFLRTHGIEWDEKYVWD